MDLQALLMHLDGVILDARQFAPDGREKSIALTDLETARWRLGRAVDGH